VSIALSLAFASPAGPAICQHCPAKKPEGGLEKAGELGYKTLARPGAGAPHPAAIRFFSELTDIGETF
jgi:phosphoketolase